MITKFKIFEVVNTYKAGEYWLIPTDERFKQSLVDIREEKNEIQYEGQNRCWFLDQSHYVFNGNINISDYELNANKYNL